MAINTSYRVLVDAPRITTLGQYVQDSINDLDTKRITNERKFRKAMWCKKSRNINHRRIHV